MKAWHVILLLIGLVASFFIGYHVRGVSSMMTPKTDTVIIVDTLRDTVPVTVRETVTKYIQVPADTIVKYIKGDTVFLPVIQKEYSTPDYHAWVSGYNAALDSIYFFPKTVYVTQKIPARRWGLGIIGGYGAGRSGLSPYIGVGVYYRIW
ncbi:DUF6808 domain-containing protein [Parabacteroides goldsteinii]|uniref:DUF6808 domain-containing protein n=1 Tax=Parabacteroides goldsteinii TaxID=328812 RepID=UPI003F911DC6